jgi:hypothetical protein
MRSDKEGNMDDETPGDGGDKQGQTLESLKKLEMLVRAVWALREVFPDDAELQQQEKDLEDAIGAIAEDVQQRQERITQEKKEYEAELRRRGLLPFRPPKKRKPRTPPTQS